MMNLERTILEQLDLGGDYLQPQRGLIARVNLALPVGQNPTLAEVERALQSLEGKRQVTGQNSEDRGRLWKITANGRARLAE